MPPDQPGIAGLEILLVGGAGGLGSATAALLEAEGARVVISSRQRGLRADITKANDRKWLLDAVPKLYGLVVFAGTPARGAAEDAMRQSHEVNYEGPILLAREAAERMKATGTQGRDRAFFDHASGRAVSGLDRIRGRESRAAARGAHSGKRVPGRDEYSCERDRAGSDGSRHGGGEHRVRKVRTVI